MARKDENAFTDRKHRLERRQCVNRTKASFAKAKTRLPSQNVLPGENAFPSESVARKVENVFTQVICTSRKRKRKRDYGVKTSFANTKTRLLSETFGSQRQKCTYRVKTSLAKAKTPLPSKNTYYRAKTRLYSKNGLMERKRAYLAKTSLVFRK